MGDQAPELSKAKRGAFCTWRTSPGKATAGISRQVEPRCSLLAGLQQRAKKEEVEGKSRTLHPQGGLNPQAALTAALSLVGAEDGGMVVVAQGHCSANTGTGNTACHSAAAILFVCAGRIKQGWGHPLLCQG